MMKRKGIILCLVLAAMLLLAGVAMADTADPIVTSMELSPSKLTGPGQVNVTITISNSGDKDLTDPVVLYDPAAQIVSDFGTNGAVLLKAGETATWKGTYDVNQRTLDNGSVVYFVKYKIAGANGKAVDQSQPIRAKIEVQTAEADIDVKRTITPTIASEDQKIIVRYDIHNSGTVSLLDVTIQEHKDIYKKKQTIPELKPGQTAKIEYPVTMGKKDLTSSATITYKGANDKKKQTYKVEKQTIKFGIPSLEASLASSAKGAVINGTVTLTLTLKNTGSVDYTDIRVTDATLGDVFPSQELKAGKTLELTKEVTIPETMEYQFNVTGTDESGSETTILTEAVSVVAVDPADALSLNVTATPDRTEVFEQPGMVRFTIKVENNSNVEAKSVKIAHGETTIYSFDSIPSGESRTISRDFALSMAGKYRFTVSAQDPLESTLSFDSNETQIAFSVPTPAPATPTPEPDPTPEPTFAPATIPPIQDESVGKLPKTIQKVLLPILIAAGVLLVASGALLLVAAKSRHDRKKASEAAVDQLERAKRRDYVTPAEPEEPEVPETVTVNSDALREDEEEEFELPHMKYARSARPAEPVAQEDSYDNGNGYDYGYDEQGYDNGYSDDYGYDDGYAQYDEGAYADENQQWEPMYEEEAYGDEQPEDTDQAAAAYDDSMFRRPQEEPVPTGRRSRRSRNADLNM